MTTPTNFIFDPRTLQQRLEAFKQYCAKIDFETSGEHWDALFFNNGQTPQTLAALFANPEQADGTLLPHQAFLLAFLHMMETPRRLINGIPERHRQLYYRGVLGLSERPAQPDRALLIFTPEDELSELLLPQGELFDGGQDSNGTPLHYQLQHDVLINHAHWCDLRWVMPAQNREDQVIPAWGRTVFDEEAGVAFPTGGTRLLQRAPEAEGYDVVFRGRLLVSPLLLATGAERTLTLTFGSAVVGAVSAQVSGDETWWDLGAGKPSGNSVSFTLPGDAEPLPPNGLDGYTFTAPVVQVVCSGTDPLPAITEVRMCVNGASNVSMRTDFDSAFEASEGCYPFGTEPVLDNGFAVMSEHWCNTAAEVDITLRPKWIGRPDFPTWYKNYLEHTTGIPNEAFLATGSKLVTAAGDTIPETGTALFQGATDNPLYAHITSPLVDLDDEETFWSHAVRVALAGVDFQHANYQRMLEAGAAVVGGVPVNIPYTPQFLQVLIDYTATVNALIEQYVLLPFGYQSAEVPAPELTSPQVYLGFNGITPGQQLTLYWQLTTPRPFKVDGLTWCYLAEEKVPAGLPRVRWKALGQEITDDTASLLHSGHWSTTLPEDAALNSTLMPGGRYWLQLSEFTHIELSPPQSSTPPTVPEDQPVVEDYPWLYGLYSNAGVAQMVNNATLAADHFLAPLPAGSISGSVVLLPGLAEVNQPLPSWGGLPKESEAACMARVAGWLSHRGRASTWRDISTLLQENFPEVHHIRLPGVEILDGLYIPPEGGASNGLHSAEEDNPPPTQELMVVLRAGMGDGDDPLRPILSPARLWQMQNYIMECASPWLNLRVLNPYYRTVKVEYDVEWMPDVNIENSKLRLTQAIRQHFMPWMDEQSQVELDNTLNLNAIIQVIQSQPYVDYVKDIRLDGGTAPIDTTLTVMVLEPKSGIAAPRYPVGESY